MTVDELYKIAEELRAICEATAELYAREKELREKVRALMRLHAGLESEEQK